MRERIPLIIAGSIIACGLLYLIGRRVLHKLRERRQSRQLPKRVEKAAGVLEAMMKLLDQQRDLSREITGSLEKKVREIKDLISQADDTVSRLAARASTLTLTRDRADTEIEEVDKDIPLETGTSTEERAALFGSVTAVSPTRSPLLGSRLSAEEKQRLVYMYSDGGMDMHEIARQMKLGKGEVKLILSLRQGE
jgi:hypothetical protein